MHGKHGIFFRRQNVKQYREGYKIVGADEQQMPTAPQPQAQPQMPTAQRRPTEQELAIPQQPSQEFLSRVAGGTPTQEETQQTTMEAITKGKLPPGAPQTSGTGAQTTQGQGAAIAPEKTKEKLEDLHNAYMHEAGSSTQITGHSKGHTSYHTGLYEGTQWGVAPKFPAALKTIEDAVGHPMLLGGILTAAAGFPAYLETRAGYGKTTMARALKQRIDSLYKRAEKGDREAARELARLPFADVVVIEPKSEIAELIGYLYVSPDRKHTHDPSVVHNLANYLIAEGRAETMEEATKLANELLDESVTWMTGGGVSGTTAIAPTEEIATALQRAALWRMPNQKMAKPVAVVLDDAHTPTFWEMLKERLKTALAANTMYGMPYVRVSYLFLANPNELDATSEFASRLMPWITPADVTVQYGMREIPTLSEFIQAAGREIAEVALEKVLGQSIAQIGDISKVLNDEKIVQKLKEQFDEELRERPADYGVMPHEVEEVSKLSPEAYLTGDLGMPHYMDAIATSVSEAGLDAVTAGWHWRPEAEVDVDSIYSQYAQTPGFKAAYTDEELKELAERHAAFASAVRWNESMALMFLDNDGYELPDWKRVMDFIDAHGRSRGEKINWYNERSAMNRKDIIEAGPDRGPRDWQRFVSLPALFGAMGRPDMAAYTIGAIGGIDPEVTMPDITVNDPPSEVDRKLDGYFTAQNLSPSVKAMLQGQQLTPEEYAEGLKQYARAVIFTTQAEGGA